MNPKVVQDSSKSYIELKAIIAAIPDEATKKAVQAVVDKMYEHQEENDEGLIGKRSFLGNSMIELGSKRGIPEKIR